MKRERDGNRCNEKDKARERDGKRKGCQGRLMAGERDGKRKGWQEHWELPKCPKATPSETPNGSNLVRTTYSINFNYLYIQCL